MNAPTFILCNFKRSIYLMLCFIFGLNFVVREVLRTIKTFKTQFQFRVSELFSAVPPDYLSPGSHSVLQLRPHGYQNRKNSEITSSVREETELDFQHLMKCFITLMRRGRTVGKEKDNTKCLTFTEIPSSPVSLLWTGSADMTDINLAKLTLKLLLGLLLWLCNPWG